MNLENLARSIEGDVLNDEEILVTVEHEANVGPWKKLAARKGLTLKHWHPRITDPSNPYSLAYDVQDLLPLIKTRLVAFSACSNILGSIIPVKNVIAATRSRAAELGVRRIEFSVDCVAYAPHRRMDVQDCDVDYAVFSFYKVSSNLVLFNPERFVRFPGLLPSHLCALRPCSLTPLIRRPNNAPLSSSQYPTCPLVERHRSAVACVGMSMTDRETRSYGTRKAEKMISRM
ncbi:hypothetical protein EDB92DRAFT_1850161 [Lactarius akahatsu]|uniref:Aminotransferase class V domain-containing protein n=1 Tax=Lactarius akahatsu TaxID=416441 RepID=A0AAD4LL63_9AGAM|nr:hypothetical protein EDB92DRAFT_1850161 [Lactarius akahatsu]